MNRTRNSIVAYTNSLLLIATNALVFSTWYSVYRDGDDTMFLILFLIPLSLVTIYYLVLFWWGIRIVVKLNSGQHSFNQSVVLFFMNAIPMLLIYHLTS